MTKHRLMLSAATAALLAAPLTISAAHAAATTITDTRKAAINTTTLGDITISTGGVDIKAASPAVTINSNNFLLNQGSISNQNTAGAIGILVDTTAGDIVNSSGITNLGSINLTGNGTGKSALVIQGGHTFFAPITFSNVVSVVGSTVAGSSVSVIGDTSNIFTLVQGTTIDGDVTMGGTMVLSASDKSTSFGNTAVDIEGNLQGNFIIGQGATLTSVGNQARGIVVLGPITACVNNAGNGYTCANSGTATASTGTFANFGSIAVLGTINPNRKGGNFESGSAIVIGNSIAGGFLNAGPSTSNGVTPSATISGNGAVINSSNGSLFAPVVLIDPSQTISSLNPTVRGPAILGPVGTQIDPVDGGKGYG
ncbi:MAG: hypothetical protein ABI450_10480, partial [Rhizomicrobium sp.]